MRVTACPFCGITTAVPHETQELCIAALHGEIALMRAMVDRVKDPQRARGSQERDSHRELDTAEPSSKEPQSPTPPDHIASARD
jgi:hypothetical protein